MDTERFTTPWAACCITRQVDNDQSHKTSVLLLDGREQVTGFQIPGELDRPFHSWMIPCATGQMDTALHSFSALIKVTKELLLLIKVQPHEGIQANQLMLYLIDRSCCRVGTEVRAHARQ